MTTNQEKHEAMWLMRDTGGSFAKALAAAWFAADKDNKKRIEVAFADLFSVYIEKARYARHEKVS